MAAADYYHCDVCGGKAFYDAHIDWDTTYLAVQDEQPLSMRALCAKCFESYEVIVRKREEASACTR